MSEEKRRLGDRLWVLTGLVCPTRYGAVAGADGFGCPSSDRLLVHATRLRSRLRGGGAAISVAGSPGEAGQARRGLASGNAVASPPTAVYAPVR